MTSDLVRSADSRDLGSLVPRSSWNLGCHLKRSEAGRTGMGPTQWDRGRPSFLRLEGFRQWNQRSFVICIVSVWFVGSLVPLLYRILIYRFASLLAKCLCTGLLLHCISLSRGEMLGIEGCLRSSMDHLTRGGSGSPRKSFRKCPREDHQKCSLPLFNIQIFCLAACF